MTYEEKLEQNERDLQVLENYSKWDDDLFIKKYEEVTERLRKEFCLAMLDQIEREYGTKYETLSDDRNVNEKLKEFLEANPIKIRK